MRNYFLLLCGVLIQLYAAAQAPLNSSDLNSTIGTQFKEYTANSNFAGSSGTNQTWDFTSLQPEAEINASTFEYGNTGSESSYPNANAVISIDFDSSFEFYRIEEDAFSYHGSFEEGGLQLSYSDPTRYCIFPLELGSDFQDTFTFNYNLEGQEGEASGGYNAEVDGHGTLQLPWGDLADTYRVHGVISQTEDLEINGMEVTATYEGLFTSFFTAGYPAPVLQVRAGTLTIDAIGFSQSQQTTNFLGDFEFLSVGEVDIVKDLKVFPNPSNGLFTLTFENKSNRDISLEVMDIQGRVVHAEAAIGSGFGSVRHEFNLSDLNPGFYLMRLSDGEHFQSRKIQVVR